MIQRIQSLYLSMTTLISLLFLKGNILNFINNEGIRYAVNFRGLGMITGENKFELISNMVPLSVMFILIPLISLIAVFLFRYRRIQLKVTLSLIILSLLLIAVIAYYAITVTQDHGFSLVVGYKMFLPLLILILALLGYRGVKKDEELVRSYERLR
ncbi:MAG: DUF4293 domain-containing protein [Bacteroidales bacterium]|nr:DUF4293 domain-containing protein [Bacteroidales bacterium]